MLTIETKELEISIELKRKVGMICKFACVKPTITNELYKGDYLHGKRTKKPTYYENVVDEITAYHQLNNYNDSDLHDIADGTSREKK